MQEFYNIAAQQDWNLNTQVDVLLEYIENQQSNEAFINFIHEKSDNHEHPGNTGLTEALENLSYGCDRKLYLCSIGVFATSNCEEPTHTYKAFVAEKSMDDAMSESLFMIENKFGRYHQGSSFATHDEPEIIDPETLKPTK